MGGRRDSAGHSGIDVLYEDNHLVVVNKPPLVPTMGVAAGGDSMVARVKEYLRVRYHKPGNVWLGVVSRLDAHASGVLVFARTSKAASRIALQFREQRVKKTYLAILDGEPDPAIERLVDSVIKDDARRRMIVVSADHPGARRAELIWSRRGRRSGPQTLVEIDLVTGRKHQIRLQFATRGAPILGDRKYGSVRPFQGIALHARSIILSHPVLKTDVTFSIDPPDWWKIGLFDDI